MELKKFKERLRRNYVLRVRFLSDYNAIERAYGWEHNCFDSTKSKQKDKVLYDIYIEKNDLKRKLRALKGMTEYLDYKCAFDKTGKCRGTRKKNAYWEGPACCCRDCPREIGYLKFVPENAVKYYADLFDEKMGFWRPGEGCQIADRSLRSETCLRYSCHPDENFKDMFYVYGGEIRRLEEQIQELQRKENRHKKKKKS